MVFWLIAAALTIVATLSAVWPLFRADGAAATARADHDVEVYRAQLAELESDAEQGVISAGDAETARAEIGRRLLRADRTRRTNESGRGRRALGTRSVLAVVFAVAVIVPILSAGLYTVLGYAGTADLPLAARRGPASGAGATVAGGERSGGALGGAPDGRSMDTMIEQAEARLEAEPDDGRGWDVLAPIYLRRDRPEDAREAFANAIRLLGPSAEREAGLGEAMTRLADGDVTDEAHAAFERALDLDATYLPARFFLAMDASQEGRFEAAETAWASLIEDSPDGAPWMQLASAALADARRRNDGDAPSPATRSAQAGPPVESAPERPSVSSRAPSGSSGPSREQVAAAAATMEPGDRRAAIEGMVSRLAARLENQPDDVEGWKRLIRSYTVLGETAKAADAFRTATATFEDGSDGDRALRDFARRMGLSAAPEDNGS